MLRAAAAKQQRVGARGRHQVEEPGRGVLALPRGDGAGAPSARRRRGALRGRARAQGPHALAHTAPESRAFGARGIFQWHAQAAGGQAGAVGASLARGVQAARPRDGRQRHVYRNGTEPQPGDARRLSSGQGKLRRCLREDMPCERQIIVASRPHGGARVRWQLEVLQRDRDGLRVQDDDGLRQLVSIQRHRAMGQGVDMGPGCHVLGPGWARSAARRPATERVLLQIQVRSRGCDQARGRDRLSRPRRPREDAQGRGGDEGHDGQEKRPAAHLPR